MMSPTKPSLKKPPIFQLSELVDGFRVCQELAKLAGKDPLFVSPLSAQLRAMLTDKSRASKALLIRLAEKFGDFPDIYYLPFDEPPEELSASADGAASLFFSNPRFSTSKVSPKHIAIGIGDVPEIQLFTLNGTKRTIRDVVEWQANKFGGAHYAERVSELDALLKYQNIGTTNAFLVEFGQFVAGIGNELINRTMSLEVNVQVRVNSLPDTGAPVYFVTCGVDEKKVFWGIGLTREGKLFFLMKDFVGNIFADEMPEFFPVNETVHIRATYELLKDFEAMSTLYLDGKPVAQTGHKSPMVFPNTHSEYTISVNRNPHSKSAQDFSFFFGKMLTYREVYDAALARKLEANFAANKDPFMCVEIRPNAYGEQRPFESGMVFTGTAIYRKLS